MFFYNFILLLPSLVAFGYFIIHLPRTDKNVPQKALLWLCIMSVIYYLSTAYLLTPNSDPVAITYIAPLHLLSAPTLAIIAFQMLYSLGNQKRHVSHVMFLYCIPVAMGVAGVAITLMMGKEDSVIFWQEYALGEEQTVLAHPNVLFVNMYKLCNMAINIVVIAEFVVLTLYTIFKFRRKHCGGEIFRFLFSGDATSPYCLMSWLVLFGIFTCFIQFSLGRAYMIENHGLNILFSIIQVIFIHYIGYTGLMLHATDFTLYELTHLSPAKSEAITAEFDPIEQAAEEHVENPFCQKIRDAVEGQQLYLNPEFTIDDLAEQLSTNRVYLSRAINQDMRRTFRDYINDLRIEFAKSYMREHPDATQEDVAIHSGYIDAPALNRKFKQIVGFTPRDWAHREGVIITG